MQRIGLISTPWPIFNRPSIQLGALKGYLLSEIPDIAVDTFHFYLSVAERIGYPLYHALSEKTIPAETVFGALLYPERFGAVETVYRDVSFKSDGVQKPALAKLAETIEDVSTAFVESNHWEKYDVIGFSVCLCQLTSSLYMIRRIKAVSPHSVIVVGGSIFSGESGYKALPFFPEIDIFVNGEGERPLANLVQHLREGRPNRENLSKIPGIIARETRSDQIRFDQIENLGRLPVPNYDDFFEHLAAMKPEKRFFPILPVEMSRGCWWRSHRKEKDKEGCSFCNLNLQWNGYRSKSADQVINEIENLSDRHKLLSFAFMDNLLPMNAFHSRFGKLAETEKDYRFFGEIRATTPKTMLQTMATSGFHQLQIGIEALSTSLLKKMNKGTTAIVNLEIMKNCEALELFHHSNLIIGFPGSDENDVRETLRVLEFALPFRPLRTVRFWLGFGSPAYMNPKKYGMITTYNHPNYRILFPEDIVKEVPFTVQAYRGDVVKQKKMWKPVKRKVEEWKKAYEVLHRGAMNTPVLSMLDGQDFLIVRQRVPSGDPVNHRLTGTSREIYLFCQKHRGIKRICDRFPRFAEDKILAFLKMMVDKKLMFTEDNHFLSLAVPIKPRPA